MTTIRAKGQYLFLERFPDYANMQEILAQSPAIHEAG